MAVTGLDKVFVVNAETNTKYGGVDPTGEFVTINDLVPQPYKVYTALLTQSGDDNPDSTYSGDLLIGRTYQIFDLGGAAGYDFTNVGAPNNNIDTWFVATGTTPNSWGTNVCLNYNTGAPVVTVLENTIGNIWFEYAGVGYYNVWTSPEALFPIGKTVSFIGSVGEDVASASYGFLRPNGSDKFFILTKDSSTDSNNQLNNTPIEIRVYN
jgi:hypothetical protein